uniref:Cold-shock DNA-binding domain protein n=1 Tax=Sphingobium chungbukense TaxID=56193 RepID=G3KBA7_9SPHN|nr:cold-shock DNA-binding domain protein [Sphingobium chungbukense]
MHVTAVLEAGYADLEKGQRWAFDLAEDRGKQIAVNLIAI